MHVIGRTTNLVEPNESRLLHDVSITSFSTRQ